MKAILITLLISLTLSFAFSAALPQPAQAVDTSTFNVTDLLSTETNEGGNEGDIVDGDTITERFLSQEDQGVSGVGVLILRVINILSLLVGTFAVILFIIAGFMLATAQGEESRIDRGKAIINQALGGVLIAFFSYIIVTLIQSFFY